MEAAPAFGFRRVSDRLGWWNLYFIAKLALFVLGLIGLHLVENLAFAVALGAMAGPRFRPARPWLGAPVALALLYYDSYLPGLARVISQMALVAGFSGAYLAELAGRFVSVKALAVLAAAAVAYAIVARFMRLDVFVVIAMLVVPLVAGKEAAKALPETTAAAAKGGATPATPDAMLAEFFRKEAGRSVAFPKPPEASANFDVVFLHVCSLSWDDLEAIGLANHPLIAGFDILFRRFNSVSTYSGPAAIRFLRAPCGQATHKALYAPAAPQCLLMPDLQQAGFETQLILNHDGHFDGFLKIVRDQGVQAPPQSLKGIEAPMRAFDGSRIYDDAAILARWIEARASEPAPRAAVYYNTLSLHDGNTLQSNPGRKSSETYKARVKKLLDDIQAFVDKLGSSGRRAVVVLVPEHGAAWRGDATQIAGLREIPTPAITLVPVGVRVIGPDARRVGDAVQVAQPASFLALSEVVARMLAKPPFGENGFVVSDYAANLPLTDFVSEGSDVTVQARGQGYAIRQDQDAWKELR
jgi:cellulose synthase operon protein YhjU